MGFGQPPERDGGGDGHGHGFGGPPLGSCGPGEAVVGREEGRKPYEGGGEPVVAKEGRFGRRKNRYLGRGEFDVEEAIGVRLFCQARGD